MVIAAVFSLVSAAAAVFLVAGDAIVMLRRNQADHPSDGTQDLDVPPARFNMKLLSSTCLKLSTPLNPQA